MNANEGQIAVVSDIKSGAVYKAWKPPTRREFKPKPADPGQRIIWTHTVGYTDTETRTGTIWSAGARPNSVWVQPDDAPHGDMVLVMLRDMTQSANHPAGWARDATRRAENVRRHGSVYAVQEQVIETYSWAYRRTETYHVLSWHADPQCPQAAGKERDDRDPWSARDVVAILAGERQSVVNPRFCNHCIYLTEPAVASAA